MTDVINRSATQEDLVATVEHCLGLSPDEANEVQAGLTAANGDPRFVHLPAMPDAVRSAGVLGVWLRWRKGDIESGYVVGPYGVTDQRVAGIALWFVSVEQVNL